MLEAFMMRGCFLASLLCCSMLASAASAAAAPSAPDLSGAWARTIFALEPPASGAGPLRNAPRQGDAGPGYTSPILKPAAAAIVKQRYESTQAGKPYPTPSETCWPMVAPMIYRVREMQVVQNKDEVLLIYMQDHEVRRIRIGGTHPANLAPTWHGDSIGHYEGDTLVVDTVGMKVGPINVIDQAGSPYSKDLHVVERYRLISYEETKATRERDVLPVGALNSLATPQAAGIDENYQGKGLQIEFTVEDPNVFNTPWSGRATYSKADDIWVENVCAENAFEYYNKRDAEVPKADRPDF
jgi:hypothetical protein